MNIYVDRDESAPTGTPGRLTLQSGGFECDTLEPPWLNNQPEVSCINAGSYDCFIWFSPSLKRNVLRLEDKHGRKNVLVHNANFAGTVDNPDTPDVEISQVKGCTAVGDGFGQIEVPKKLAKKPGQKQFGIMNSTVTLQALLQELPPGHHTIHYRWKDGCAPKDLSDLNPESDLFVPPPPPEEKAAEA